VRPKACAFQPLPQRGDIQQSRSAQSYARLREHTLPETHVTWLTLSLTRQAVSNSINLFRRRPTSSRGWPKLGSWGERKPGSTTRHLDLPVRSIVRSPAEYTDLTLRARKHAQFKLGELIPPLFDGALKNGDTSGATGLDSDIEHPKIWRQRETQASSSKQSQRTTARKTRYELRESLQTALQSRQRQPAPNLRSRAS